MKRLNPSRFTTDRGKRWVDFILILLILGILLIFFLAYFSSDKNTQKMPAAYYAVKVVVTTERENGTLKNHTEMHLVAGETPEDAASKTRVFYGAETRDYTVDDVKKTRYLSVID